MKSKHSESTLMTTAEHLEALRGMLFRIAGVVVVLAIAIFCFKEKTFSLLLAAKSSDFITFRVLKQVLAHFGIAFNMSSYQVSLISTDLSAQFMTHITMSFYLALVLASPYILFELFRFISPALYEKERKYSVVTTVCVYGLFIIGMLISYFIVFPISIRFLATYQVDASVQNNITLDSYITTFTTLTFLMGCIFQLPVIAFVLSKMGLISKSTLKHYRKWALVIIMLISAMITPPDLFTLFLVTVPMYGLYELSVCVVK